MSPLSPTQHCMLCLLSLEESSHLPVLPSRLWTLLVQGDPARTGIRGQGQDKGLVRFRVEVKIIVWVKAGVWVRDSARVRVRAGSQIQSQDHLAHKGHACRECSQCSCTVSTRAVCIGKAECSQRVKLTPGVKLTHSLPSLMQRPCEHSQAVSSG